MDRFELALMVLLGLGATLSAGAVHAQTPSVVFATADVTPSVVAPCDATTVSGAKWEPDTEVTISLDGAQGEALAIAVVNSDGTLTATAQIPCDTSVGLHAIAIFGDEQEGILRRWRSPSVWSSVPVGLPPLVRTSRPALQ